MEFLARRLEHGLVATLNGGDPGIGGIVLVHEYAGRAR